MASRQAHQGAGHLHPLLVTSHCKYLRIRRISWRWVGRFGSLERTFLGQHSQGIECIESNLVRWDLAQCSRNLLVNGMSHFSSVIPLASPVSEKGKQDGQADGAAEDDHQMAGS